MKNLVITLQGEFENQNLPIYNTLRINGVVYDTAGTTPRYTVGFTAYENTLTIKAPYGILHNGTEVPELTSNATTVDLVNHDDNDAQITNIYNILSLLVEGDPAKRNCILPDLNSAIGYGKLRCLDISVKNKTVKASDICNIAYCKMNGQHFIEDISISGFLAANRNAIRLEVMSWENITTDMLENMEYLEELVTQSLNGDITKLPKSLYNIYLENAEGSIEDYIAAMREKGTSLHCVKLRNPRFCNNVTINDNGQTKSLAQYWSDHFSSSVNAVYLSWDDSTVPNITITSSAPASYPSTKYMSYYVGKVRENPSRYLI